MDRNIALKSVCPCMAFAAAGLLAAVASGESVWVKYGNQVFQGAGDAKSIALSESEVASASGPLAILWNPARLYAEHEESLVYAHQERFAGAVIFDIIGFDLKHDFRSRWSIVFIRNAVQGIPNTLDALLYNTGSLDDEKERILRSRVTYFNQVQFAGVVGFAATYGEWTVGGSAKLLMHQLDRHRGYGIGFDLGAYRSFVENNTVGISLRDASTSWIIWDSGNIERIAPRLVLGDVHTLPIDRFSIELRPMASVAANLAGRSTADDFSFGPIGGQVRIGLDVKYKDNFHLRMGRNPTSKFSVGLGFGFPFGQIDYAFTPSPVGSILGTSHYVSLNLKLDTLDSLKERLSD